MFKNYKDLCDVVSLLVYCPNDRSFLFVKEPSGELWIPTIKSEKNCWKMTANKINFELFGLDIAQCCPLRVYKIWLPQHPLQSVYHVVYKVAVKTEVKKRMKIKSLSILNIYGLLLTQSRNQGARRSMAWYNMTELDRQKAHSNLRSPEVFTFAFMALGDLFKDYETQQDIENGNLIEICEDNVVLGGDVAGGAVAMASHNYQLLRAANYTRDDQIRLYREFILMVYPATYMSVSIFTQFMVDIGWQRAICPNLFRAADVTGRGGLSFLELMLWSAASEPVTQHTGVPAEIRCRYIFRYFDSNRDMKLECVELKELMAAARGARQLPVDALSVARDAEVCLRQLGLQPNAQLTLTEFLRSIGELRIRGTSSMLRAPRSISGYLMDLHDSDREILVGSPMKLSGSLAFNQVARTTEGLRTSGGAGVGACWPRVPDYSLALYTVRMHKRPPNEMIELNSFDEDAISPSTTRLLATARRSLEVLSANSMPVEALAAVHYFANAFEKPNKRAPGSTTTVGKAANSWASPSEEAALGILLLKLAEAVRPICESEPRLLRINSPVYVIGDLHGNLNALLSMESSLWSSGTNLAAAHLLFLGDFVDRGAHGTELMAYLLAAKLQRPSAVLLVRGNHETRDIQKMFTFYTECITKYGETDGNKIWNAINNVFDALPLAAIVDDKVFCCHGGIPPPWLCPLVSAIDKIPVPLTKPVEQSSLAWELLWNDPVKPNKMTATLQLELAANEGFAANTKRGTGHVFDQTALDRFLHANQLSHVVRAHELQQSGFMCQLRGRLITVFSSYRYCGANNDSGVALLEDGKLRLIRLNID